STGGRGGPGSMHEDPRSPVGPGGSDRAGLLRRIAAMAGAGMALPALSNVESALAAADGGSNGNYPNHPKWKFVFINHVTTNPFFVPTQYGIQDACALVNCSYQWTGDQNANV